MKNCIVLLLVLVSFSFCKSQTSKDLTPLQITEFFLSTSGFENKNLYLCCEMKIDIESDSSLGQYIPDSVARRFDVLYQDSVSAVTTVELSDSKMKSDWYFYLKKDGYWKIEAMRALALTGLGSMMLEKYQNISEDSIKIIDSLLGGKYNIAKLIKQTRLQLSSDKELIDYFLANKNSFVNLMNIFLEKFKDTEDSKNKFNEDPLIKKSLDSLVIHSFTSSGRLESGNAGYCFMIGGVLDNTVGFFYETDKTKVPKMSKSGFIMIREIGDGWYLYKTT